MSSSPRSSEVNVKYAAEKSPAVVESVLAIDHDADAQKLVEMGKPSSHPARYQPQLRRNFGIWSVLGVGFSVTNSWWGISAGLIAGVNSGGPGTHPPQPNTLTPTHISRFPVLVIYGIILIALVSTGVGISLAELASAMPNSGGQYYWTSQLAPRRWAPLLSFLTGAVGWAGAVFTSASVCLSLGSSLVGMYALGHPDLVIQPWMVFVTYQLVNLFTFVLNCSGKLLPTISAVSLWTSLISCFVITIAIPAASQTKQPAKFVFATFVNETGWENNVIAFIVGLINPNWSFACLDVATHMAEEIPNPERMIPISILATVGIGLVSALGYSIAIFFSLTDLAGVSSTATGVPILELYHQATRSVAGAIVMQVLIVLTGLGCLTACHTWQARLAWSFARDRGMPGSRRPSERAYNELCMGGNPRLPLHRIHNRIQQASHTFCCLLARGRSSIRPGPFWLGGFGLFSNIVLLCWTAFTLVFYDFPFVMPVQAGNMNYVCAVIGIYGIYLSAYWMARGRRTFKVHDKNADAITGN
ncbi:hypothetical protein FRC10_007180 [Ceratobasidium sp. 414]|nr:hypothetical protein FRC10_007180 [Ceratobasidium sp. 414]